MKNKYSPIRLRDDTNWQTFKEGLMWAIEIAERHNINFYAGLWYISGFIKSYSTLSKRILGDNNEQTH